VVTSNLEYFSLFIKNGGGTLTFGKIDEFIVKVEVNLSIHSLGSTDT
jgi:hypothetical protein